MSDEGCDYVVVYDVSSNRERRHVDKVMKGFGQRIQKSVFECRMRKSDLNELVRKLDKVHLSTGFVKIYRLEHSWVGKVFGEEAPEAASDSPILTL